MDVVTAAAARPVQSQSQSPALLSLVASSTFSNAGTLHVYATEKVVDEGGAGVAAGRTDRSIGRPHTVSIQNITLPTSTTTTAPPSSSGTTVAVPLLPATLMADGILKPGTAYTIRTIYITDPITLSWPVLPGGNVQVAHSLQLGKGLRVSQPPPTPNLQRRLDIYGDSITAGNQINATTCAPDWSGTNILSSKKSCIFLKIIYLCHSSQHR